MQLSANTVARVIGESYNQHVGLMPPTDFWGQVKRHVFGRPVSNEQIQLIVEVIKGSLAFRSEDILLDLACGNGALTHELIPFCAGWLGVDVSEALIAVASQYFAMPGRAFIADDIASYVDAEPNPDRFTKALCYGSFPYLHSDSAQHVLEALHARFSRLQQVFIGNLPDLNRMQAFYPGRAMDDPAPSDPLSEIGVWRTPGAFIDLAGKAGWLAELRVMPPSFYAAHYRYDALLTRKNQI